MLIDAYLTELQKALPQYFEDESVVEELTDDINNLRNSLTTKTKRYVIKSICYLWGKASKYSLKFIQDLHQEGRKEAIKAIVKSAAKLLKDNIDTILTI
ncbi:hypothetical protein D0T53_10915 [Dysgonomonas sp. 216]|uniref:hypothetical protein n=1 Tax=Dysgonomonas sp. 216 TaxID=2302934 RepID=UPI0013D6A8F7|nr:hypothetical protein [Dysgonomonas sp. 216]NDW19415.1 hypothetical protein [Dysgonomonas sp. 216]